MNKLQMQLALEVLNKMQACVVANDTYVNGFNLHDTFGICWHVYSGTPGDVGIDTTFLYPVFAELGYQAGSYPIESIIRPDADAAELYEFQYNCRGLYDPETTYGALRIKLLGELVEYFTNKLSTAK